MRILIEQEYGWKYWIWTPPNYTNLEKLVTMMNASLEHDEDFNPADFIEEETSGAWKQIEYEEFVSIRKSREWDAIGHFHEHDDSWLALEKDAHFRNPYTGEDFPDDGLDEEVQDYMNNHGQGDMT